MSAVPHPPRTSAGLVRILSDVHLGHPASLVYDPAQLAPMFEGAGVLVFNGDTVELRFAGQQEVGHAHAAALRELAARHAAEIVFINGNHDPAIAAQNHLDLCDGAVLVTHGDMLFHDISPWSPLADHYRDAHQRELEQLTDAAFHDFEKRLAAGKRASQSVELIQPHVQHGWMARVLTLASELWPPWRPFEILKVWFETPGRAVALARVFRPRARFILIGHVHYSGIFHRLPRCVINTGSFLPFSGRHVIDIVGSHLTVRNVARNGTDFAPGEPVAEFEATQLRVHEGF